MEIKEINKVYIKDTGTEVLSIKWVSYKEFDPLVKLGINPRICFLVRFKNGKEDYVPIYENTGYPIECKEHDKNNILLIH